MTVPAPVAERIADARLSAHLATCVDDRPHVAPVWYVYDEAALWVITGGKKLRNVRRNPRVAVSIERGDESGVDWGVQILGTAREVDDESRVEAVRSRMDEKYHRGDAVGTDTDRSNEDTAGADAAETGAAESGDDPVGEWALLAIDVGSASYQQY